MPIWARVVLEVRHVIAHEVIECRRLVARKGFPRELVEIVAWPEANTFVYRDEVHESRDVRG